MRRNTDEVFWSRVDKSAGPYACWPWTGRRKPPTGGVYDHDGTWDYVHRYAWFLAYGSWPVPQANHHCDNPPCCNVKHMYEGTQADNVRDRDARNRRQGPRGELSGRAILTDAQVTEIRSRYTGARGQQSQFSQEYGVHVSTIHLIVKGTHWESDNYSPLPQTSGLSESETAELLSLFHSGVTRKELAKRFDMSYSYVTKLIQKANQ